MANIKEHSMCCAWNQRPEVGLDEGTNRFSTKMIHQPAFLMTVPSAHCLWNKTQLKPGDSFYQGIVLANYLRFTSIDGVMASYSLPIFHDCNNVI